MKNTWKAFVCLMVTLSLLGSGLVFGWEYYPTSYHWDFQNGCCFGFNQAVNVTYAPSPGVPQDSSLVGYWDMNEGSGSMANDSSGNSNNGIITDAIWVDGKYGKALRFNGEGYVSIHDSTQLQISGQFTVCAWIKLTQFKEFQNVINKGNEYMIRIENQNEGYHVEFLIFIDGVWKEASGNFIPVIGDYCLLVGVFDNMLPNSNLKLYVNGVLSDAFNINGTIYGSESPLIIGKNFYGDIDEVRFYNRALTVSEIAMLQDPILFANYYNYADPITNNTMLIHIDNPNANGNNVSLVKCTSFFTGNRLAFQANNSATVNVWTNLGQPTSTTGVWNSQNYTTTLTLNDSSTAEINWNTCSITTYSDIHSSITPSNITVPYGANQTLHFNVTQGYSFNVLVDGVSQGQIGNYTFHNVTTSHIVNVTSTQLTYLITALTDSHSSITPGNISVAYCKNQTFYLTANPRFYISHTYVDGKDQGNITSYHFANVQSNHTISIFSAAIKPTQTPSANPTSTQPSSQTTVFPIETIIAFALGITVLIIAFALALKKGYIKIEVIKEIQD